MFILFNLLRSLLPGKEELQLEHLWSIKAMPSSLHLAWKVIINKVATQVKLSKRGVHIVTSLCAMGEKEEEFA